ncbi:hypothetical protein DEO72_LG9g1667 [Vigna unguiculata]|uniref:Uncharacterized protein n=1 Tax=Vigna unguiculata TaxID=3917 RepID=A0A4D6MYT1_VIGUN|nr:hypothetical protein DEO72_LG9g1667 [Vigna unguiculata]
MEKNVKFRISPLSFNSSFSFMCVTWYFRLGELLSPERKPQGMHLYSCAKSRLGELGSPERDSESRLGEPA